MTNYRNHLIIAFVLNSFLVFGMAIYIFEIALSYFEVGMIFILTIIFALLPDFDHPSSKFTQYFDLLFVIVGAIGIITFILQDRFNILLSDIEPLNLMFISIIGNTFAHILPRFFKHRGFMHSITFALIVSGAMFLLFNNIHYFMFSLSACLSHDLIGDKIVKLR